MAAAPAVAALSAAAAAATCWLHLQPPPPSLGAVTLREVTKKNYEEVMDLRPAPDQQRFVATNAESLADMHFADGARCCECSLLRKRAADAGLESETPTVRV